MQIIIPMSGFGERFRRAGYTVPKPLIVIDGKPIISHVIDLFPGEEKFIFICNQDHLDYTDYNIEKILKNYCPTGKIIGIPPHKLGPVHAVQQVVSELNMNEPAVVNYCDFTCYWDWKNFKKFVEECKCEGAIPAYKGFHPHTLGNTNYAYMREDNGWVLDIQEKQPYTDNRMEEYASSGAYYFSSARVMVDAFNKVKENDINIGGEYYVSLAYKPLLAEGKPVSVYPLQHFMQWGTPQDVAEYNGWSNAFRRMIETQEKSSEPVGSIVIPMAGLGQRFAREGYNTAKPLIAVSGMPMVRKAVNDLPAAKQYSFVIRQDMPGNEEISSELKQYYADVILKVISEVTEGQACTAQIGLEALREFFDEVEPPITFGACDNGAIFDNESFSALVKNKNVDIVVWGARGHVNAVRHPEMFGWISAGEDGKIASVSVKKPLNEPENDPIVIGTFTFTSAKAFESSVNRLIERNGRINGEFYLDSCVNDAIELGLNCYLFEVDHLLSWGTPNDLKTFEYWQSCFHKWDGHPYKLENDHSIPEASVEELEKRFEKMVPECLEPRK